MCGGITRCCGLRKSEVLVAWLGNTDPEVFIDIYPGTVHCRSLRIRTRLRPEVLA